MREALHTGEPYDAQPPYARRALWDIAAAVALVRLELLGGSKPAKLAEMKLWVSRSHDWDSVLHIACFEAFDGALFERITPEWRWNLAYLGVSAVCFGWRLDMLPVCRWALARLDTERDAMPEHLRQQLAELLVHRGEGARLEWVLAGDDSGMADALRAAVLVQQGRWAEAQAAFEAALKKRHVETRARKRVLPDTVAWLYPLALLAQQGPRHLELAKKFCLGEAGSRNPAAL